MIFGIGFLVADILELPDRKFSLGVWYYVTLWGYLFFCIVADLMLFGPVPLGRWLVTGLASLLALYAVFIWVEAGGATPLWGQLWCSVMLLLAISSIYVVQKRNA